MHRDLDDVELTYYADAAGTDVPARSRSAPACRSRHARPKKESKRARKDRLREQASTAQNARRTCRRLQLDSDAEDGLPVSEAGSPLQAGDAQADTPMASPQLDVQTFDAILQHAFDDAVPAASAALQALDRSLELCATVPGDGLDTVVAFLRAARAAQEQRERGKSWAPRHLQESLLRAARNACMPVTMAGKSVAELATAHVNETALSWLCSSILGLLGDDLGALLRIMAPQERDGFFSKVRHATLPSPAGARQMFLQAADTTSRTQVLCLDALPDEALMSAARQRGLLVATVEPMSKDVAIDMRVRARLTDGQLNIVRGAVNEYVRDSILHPARLQLSELRCAPMPCANTLRKRCVPSCCVAALLANDRTACHEQHVTTEQHAMQKRHPEGAITMKSWPRRMVERKLRPPRDALVVRQLGKRQLVFVCNVEQAMVDEMQHLADTAPTVSQLYAVCPDGYLWVVSFDGTTQYRFCGLADALVMVYIRLVHRPFGAEGPDAAPLSQFHNIPIAVIQGALPCFSHDFPTPKSLFPKRPCK